MNAGGVLNTCKSNGPFGVSGGRVSNAVRIYLQVWDNRGKLLLIPDVPRGERLAA